MKPNAFTLSMNAKIKPDLRSVLRWLSGGFSNDARKNPHFVMWVEREVMEKCGTFAVSLIANLPSLV